jgi:hypothetical protein
LTLRYARALFKGGRISENLLVYPSITELGNLRARSESVVSFPFTSRLRLKLDLLLDFVLKKKEFDDTVFCIDEP